MSIYLYLNKNTFLHNLDPRTKIITLIILFIIIILLNNPLYLSIAFLSIILIMFFAKVIENIYKIGFLLIFLFLFCTFLWPILTKVNSSSKIFFSIPIQHFIDGFSTGVRLDCLILLGIIFISVTKIEEISVALVKMGIPYPVSFALTSAFRFVPTFMETAQIVVMAQKSRGFDVKKGNIFSRLKKYVPLIVPIFLSSIRNIHILTMALEIKGFGKGKRTYYYDIKMKIYDYLVLILLFFILIVFCKYL